MKKLTFELEFITPAFMGGASHQPELRPASFVGLLRWWWRALKGLDDTERLYEEEVEIFGGHGRDGARVGRVMLRLSGEGKISDRALKESYGLEWSYDRGAGLRGKDAGVGYLLYSVNLPGRERKFLSPGYRLKLVLIGEERYLKPVVASLWALLYLGGVGARARRGGGNLDCLRVEPEIDWLSFRPDEKLGRWLSENLKKAIELVGGGKDFCSEYSNLSFSKLLISKNQFNSWIEALNEIGLQMMEFRRQHKNKIFEMGAFGLPVRHSNNQFLKAKKSQRRASPLIIRVIRVGDKFRWIALRLSGRFLPEGEALDFGGRTGKADYKILEELRLHLRRQNLATSLKLTEPESLRRLTEKLIKAFDPQAIILFGSRARGDARRDSDIDIALQIAGDRPIDTGSFVGNLDLVDLRRADQKLKEAINLEGVLIYEKQAPQSV